MNVVWLGLARTGDGLLESALNSESQSVALERDQLDLAFGLKRGEIEIAVVGLSKPCVTATRQWLVMLIWISNS